MSWACLGELGHLYTGIDFETKARKKKARQKKIFFIICEFFYGIDFILLGAIPIIQIMWGPQGTRLYQWMGAVRKSIDVLVIHLWCYIVSIRRDQYVNMQSFPRGIQGTSLTKKKKKSLLSVRKPIDLIKGVTLSKAIRPTEESRIFNHSAGMSSLWWISLTTDQ